MTENAGAGVVPVAEIVPSPVRHFADGTWEPWVAEEVIARHYGVSPRTIRRWRRRGLPSKKFGGVRRYRLSDCVSWHEQWRSP
jgi:hypothetical protein